MSKLIICSDIHGSSDSFRRIIDFFDKGHYDKLLILGDLLYHGPRNDLPPFYEPKKVIEIANKYKDKIIMVKGNCEAEVDQMVLDFHIYNKKKLVIDKHIFYLEHGHHLDKNNPLYLNTGVNVLYGHTHVSKLECINESYFLNPGSTTLPKENTKRSFFSYENGIIKLVNLETGEILEEKELF